MSRRTSGLVVSVVSGLILMWMPSLLAETHLQYQKRANRYEGIRPEPVSGYDIELVSCIADYREETNKIPSQFKVRFYLEKPSEVSLTVRELDPQYYYWLDKVSPSQPWRQGSWNVFEWPTDEVVQQLGGISMYDLGAVLRLGKPVPARVEHVAPLVFYHSNPPSKITGYLFTFKTGSDANLAFKVYAGSDTKPVFQTFRKPRGGRAFTVRWASPAGPAGLYKLVVTGYLSDTNDPIDQIVYFYHRPIVDREGK